MGTKLGTHKIPWDAVRPTGEYNLDRNAINFVHSKVSSIQTVLGSAQLTCEQGGLNEWSMYQYVKN